MVLTKEAIAAKPHKPFDYYFKFRQQKMEKYKYDPHKLDKIRGDWAKITEQQRLTQNQKFKVEIDKWQEDMRKWRVKYGISKEEDTVHSKGKSREKSRRAGQKIKGGNTQKSQLVSKEHKNERISLAKSAKEKENVNEKLKEKSKQKSQEKSQPKPKQQRREKSKEKSNRKSSKKSKERTYLPSRPNLRSQGFKSTDIITTRNSKDKPS